MCHTYLPQRAEVWKRLSQLKRRFSLYSLTWIFCMLFLIVRSGGKCTLYCNINTTLKDIVTRRDPASPWSLMLVRHLASMNEGNWQDGSSYLTKVILKEQVESFKKFTYDVNLPLKILDSLIIVFICKLFSGFLNLKTKEWKFKPAIYYQGK